MLSEPGTALAPLTIRGEGGQWPATIVGGKGAGLLWMTSQALPVPPFFVVTTEAWRSWRAGHRRDPRLDAELRQGLRWLEEETGRTFGGGPPPLLGSVRSSGPVSMPGMMDTVLNLGLTPASLGALFEHSGSLRFVAEVVGNHLATMPGGAEPDGLAAAIEHIFASWDNDRATLYRKLRGI